MNSRDRYFAEYQSRQLERMGDFLDFQSRSYAFSEILKYKSFVVIK